MDELGCTVLGEVASGVTESAEPLAEDPASRCGELSIWAKKCCVWDLFVYRELLGSESLSSNETKGLHRLTIVDVFEAGELGACSDGKLEVSRSKVKRSGDLLSEVPKAGVAVHLKLKLATFEGGSIPYEQWLQGFSPLESTMSKHVAGAVDLSLMDKVLEDLEHSDGTLGVLALVALEDLHALIDQALQNCKARRLQVLLEREVHLDQEVDHTRYYLGPFALEHQSPEHVQLLQFAWQFLQCECWC